MKPNAHNPTAIRPAIAFLLVVVPGIVWAQDLEVQWGNYLAVEAQVDAAGELERSWVEQHENLRDEIHRLQAGQAWYNGWIIELLIARKSSHQVELADSLRQVRNTIADLTAQRAAAFSAFKKAYRQILFASEPQSKLTLSQKEQAFAIGRRLMNQGDATLDLPDYAPILDSPYEDEAVKRLVLEDLHSVLQAKLGLIDSLLTEKETEQALLNRLNEFHRDLSYQMQSNLDIGSSRDATEAGAPGEVTSGDIFVAFLGGEKSERAWGAEETQPDLATPITQSPAASGATNIQLSLDPVDDAINRLKHKRQQYQDLLQQIETEFPH